MRNAETVLGIIQERGRKQLPITDVYRQMFNPDLYLRAYNRIYRNYGANTQGISEETVDGMSMKKIKAIIEQIRYERFRWTPVRRTHIPKKNGKMRPLGIPTWTDKLVQEVMRSILEAYYEPHFSENSHGFRPNLGCHTALRKVQRWNGTVWFIEGDIKGCFDNIDHNILLSILRENIHDNRFLRLISNLLKAGYMENWEYKSTLSGTPQGGIISPLLSNIYLDRLDKFVENNLLTRYTKGERRKRNPDYISIQNKVKRRRKIGKIAESKMYRKELLNTPSNLANDPDFRRIHYVRYADDFLIGFAGPKIEAEEIKEEIKKFLQSIKLELSDEKTLITHATTEKARFLGYDLQRFSSNTKLDHLKRRSVNGKLCLYIPREVSEDRCKRYMVDGKPVKRPELIRDSDFDIVSLYGAEFRGFVQYYLLAHNVYSLNKLQWVMETSLLKTLANKYKSRVTRMARKYKSKTNTPEGPRKCFKVIIPREDKKPLIATFGGIPLIRKERATIKDVTAQVAAHHSRSELIQRMMANECELCGSHKNIQIHHIRKLADLDKPGRNRKPKWMKIMSARKRKTLAVCRDCHYKIHQGEPTTRKD
jgi:group II intron reverse transcriptase/maturase